VDGFLNLLKPPGMTSHDAVAWLRRLAATAAGHAGTLDRAAAGVLVLCLGRARRLSQWAVAADKAYVGEITFGIITDTLDADGTVFHDKDASGLTSDEVAQALRRFEGEIEQAAPAYSAVHVGGVRSHQLARQGQAGGRRRRKARIMSARLVDFAAGRHPRARIAVECSKGTYIRSLAADLGEAVGCGAYLSFLVRTRSGTFDIADSLTIEDIEAAIAAGRLEQALRPLDEPLSSLPAVRLESRAAHLAQHGGGVPAPEGSAAAGSVRMYDGAGRFLGVGEVRGDELRARVVVAG
jgi:tRNA pseudouridine55 synthase